MMHCKRKQMGGSVIPFMKYTNCICSMCVFSVCVVCLCVVYVYKCMNEGK